ncbi:KRAB-A domain-containing protein 2-like [Macrobrachium nipponense]|uniref:KRAB-A domain-containing protein 2-like n=1 Tax=Macrobrachium nipponense TaxID=159736 RepID=UPI0030C85F0A
MQVQGVGDAGVRHCNKQGQGENKFCVLYPLARKRAEEVIANLLDVFLTFGAPAILQSDNGREFANAIITELAEPWPELKLVTGRPCHPQSQGTVGRLNGVIQDKLTIWMKENNSRKWSLALKFVQWQVNISRHETTGHIPFKVTFEQDPQFGLRSSILPSTALCEIFIEEDLEAFLESKEAAGAETEAEPEGRGRSRARGQWQKQSQRAEVEAEPEGRGRSRGTGTDRSSSSNFPNDPCFG